MGSDGGDSRSLGPVPIQPRRPSCNFDTPEEHPVADGVAIVGRMLENAQTGGIAGSREAPGRLKLLAQQPCDGAEQANKEEEEELGSNCKKGHEAPVFLPPDRVRGGDTCRLQDAVLSLTVAVTRELELHRQFVEEFLLHCEPLERSTPRACVQENVNLSCSDLRSDVSSCVSPGPPRQLKVKVPDSSVHANTCDLAVESAELLEPNLSTKVHKQSSAGATLSALDFGEGVGATFTPFLMTGYCRGTQRLELPDIQVKPSPLSPSQSSLRASRSTFHIFSQDQDFKRMEMLEDYNRMKGQDRKSGVLGLAGISGEAGESSREMCIGYRFFPLRRMRQFMTSRPFSIAVAALILLNAVFVGIMADSTLRRAVELFKAGQTPISLLEMSEPWQEAVDVTFTFLFTVELLLRIGVFQLSFLIGPDWKWNMFDTVVVLEAIVGFVLTQYNLALSWARLFRLVRLLRSLRVMRVLRYFRRLRLMLISVLGSLIPVLWAAIFLLLVLFIFSVVIADGVTESLSKREKAYGDGSTSYQADHDIIYYFGNLPMVLLSHFIAVTGGISWWELGNLLSKISWAYVAVFLIYITVMVLMVLNIITGIFVNDAIEISQTDREFAAEAVLLKEKAVFKELHEIFHDLDENEDGLLYFGEFKERVRLPEIRAILGNLGIDMPDALRFFHLLDVDNSGTVEIDEFVMGCMNIKGRGGTVSLEAMMAENKRMMRHYFRTMPKREGQEESRHG